MFRLHATEKHVKRTGAAVLRLGRGNREDKPAHPGFVQPARHRLLQNAAAEPAMAGDDQNASAAGGA